MDKRINGLDLPSPWSLWLQYCVFVSQKSNTQDCVLLFYLSKKLIMVQKEKEKPPIVGCDLG